MTFYEKIVAFIMSIIALFTGVSSGVQNAKPVRNTNFDYLEYPAEAIINPADIGLSREDFQV